MIKLEILIKTEKHDGGNGGINRNRPDSKNNTENKKADMSESAEKNQDFDLRIDVFF